MSRTARPARTPGLTAREEILARLRTALSAEGQPEPLAADDIPRAYQRADDKQESTDPAKVREMLVKRLADAGAAVHRTTAEELPDALAAALGDAQRIGVPSGLPPAWLEGLTGDLVTDSPALTVHDLDALDAVVTGCHTAVALTGTIMLRADETGGRRALTLIPDHHVVVVDAEQVVVGVPKGIARMAEDPAAPWTMITGPSATSDIELQKVDGVHGPRRLDVVLVEPPADSTEE